MCGDFVRCQLSHIEAKSPRIPSLLSVPGEIGEAEVRQRPFLCSEGQCRQQVPRQLTYIVRHLLADLVGMGLQLLQVLGQVCVQL